LNFYFELGEALRNSTRPISFKVPNMINRSVRELILYIRPNEPAWLSQ